MSPASTDVSANDVPNPDELAEIEDAARNMIAAASTIVMKHYDASVKVEFKDKHKSDPVTKVDREVEAFLSKAISARFPGHTVLGEEGQEPDGPAEYVWVVDPLDGTLNFINGLACFAISIGVLHKGKPVVGAVALPATSEIMHARLGGGTYRDGGPIHIRDVSRPRPDILGCLSSGHRFAFRTKLPLLRRLGDSRSFGSIAYELGLVASGAVGYAVFRSPKIWDIAGGAVLVHEAGGQVLGYDFGGRVWKPLDAIAPQPSRDTQKPPSLRNWGLPVIVAPPRLAETLALGLTPRSAPPKWLRQLLRILNRYRS